MNHAGGRETHAVVRRPGLRGVTASVVLVVGLVVGCSTSEDDSVAGIPTCDAIEDAAAPKVDGALSADAEVAAAQQERARLGFPSDETSTRRATVNGRTLGMPLSPQEREVLGRRQQHLSEQMMTNVDSYAAEHADQFTGRWVDQSRGGVFVVGMTGDVEDHQAALDELLGVGAVTVRLTSVTASELDRINEAVRTWAVGRVGGSSGWGTREDLQVVAVDLEVLDPEVVASLAEAAGTDHVCVTGADPEDVVRGPQLPSGDGWRLLRRSVGIGGTYTVAVARDQAEYAALWGELGVAGEPDPVDLESELVVAWQTTVSTGCEDTLLLGLDVIDGPIPAVAPDIRLEGGNRRAWPTLSRCCTWSPSTGRGCPTVPSTSDTHRSGCASGARSTARSSVSTIRGDALGEFRRPDAQRPGRWCTRAVAAVLS